jgi:hypothetical protein
MVDIIIPNVPSFLNGDGNGGDNGDYDGNWIFGSFSRKFEI